MLQWQSGAARRGAKAQSCMPDTTRCRRKSASAHLPSRRSQAWAASPAGAFLGAVLRSGRTLAVHVLRLAARGVRTHGRAHTHTRAQKEREKERERDVLSLFLSLSLSISMCKNECLSSAHGGAR